MIGKGEMYLMLSNQYNNVGIRIVPETVEREDRSRREIGRGYSNAFFLSY